MNQTAALPAAADLETRTFIIEVYRWMTAGLAVTGGVCVYMAGRENLIMALALNRILFFGLIIAEILVVIGLAACIRMMSASVATVVFLAYAALNGVTMSLIFLAFSRASVANAFFVTAGTFAAMSLYGQTTKTDLTTVGNLCMQALFGLIIATCANFFFHSARLDLITTYAGVLIFTGLTAYDTQKIKKMSVTAGGEEETKTAISGALALYLDFINLFMDILKIVGDVKD